jgi:hydroxyacylglutathione hydrolase
MMNTYLLSYEGQAWIIDAGHQPDELLACIAQEALSLQAILMTHAHIDHIEGLMQLHEAHPDVPIFLHPDEQCWWDAVAFQASYFNYPRVPQQPPAKAIQWLDATQSISPLPRLGDEKITFEVRHCPGHTPGGVSFYSASLGVVFTGDTLFKGAVGRWDFPYGDVDALEASLRSQLLTLPESTSVFSGHGTPTTIGAEMQTPERFFGAS